MKLNKITKKYAMEQLNNKVQFIGSYINTDYIHISKFLFMNFENEVLPYLKKAEIRSCCKQSNNSIVFEKPNGTKTYLDGIIGSRWYEAIIENKKFIIIDSRDGFTTCYHILED